MVYSFFTKLFQTNNSKALKHYWPIVNEINALSDEINALTNDQLRSKTIEFKAQLEKGGSLDELLVPAFAVVREAATRVLNQRHYDVQLLGGIVLNHGKIAEMKTGEGKTLVATLPVYLNALKGLGVHVVTVNDYLATRDAEWMGKIYELLGLSVGTITGDQEDVARREAYACDITYGTNNEFGFDYLRDHMKYDKSQLVQRGHHFAIIDEVDSILIDESRTPLIISGPAEGSSELYLRVDTLVRTLPSDSYTLDEKQNAVTLNELGNELVEQKLKVEGLLKSENFYDAENINLVHHVNQALRAHCLFRKDRDYIIKNNKIVIIDEFTGRMMEGRRYSEGLHQALEAKEKVEINPENQTFASITFQNYFRLYDKLAGMTGTAMTEVEEFRDIYNLDVVQIPTNKPVARLDENDEIYRNQGEKLLAIIKEIDSAHARHQPVLVGTNSIEKSEILAQHLVEHGYKLLEGRISLPKFNQEEFSKTLPTKSFRVLNARSHEQEAYIVAEAGAPGAITIATNIAGRGTDIKLGGSVEILLNLFEQDRGSLDDEQRNNISEEIKRFVEWRRKQVLDSGEQNTETGKRFPGGLYIIGTERNEARRIDNQLRGRSGRQGDPGRSKFYLSLEDDLMRLFGSEKMESLLVRLGLKPNEAITHPWINKAIAKSQYKVEQRNYDIRKSLLKYDDVVNEQRKLIFTRREEFVFMEDLRPVLNEMRHKLIEDMVDSCNSEHLDQEISLYECVINKFDELYSPLLALHDEELRAINESQQFKERMIQLVDHALEAKFSAMDPELARHIEKQIVIQTLDTVWREHLSMLDHLKQVIGWRSFAQKDPLNEFKAETYQLFDKMIQRFAYDTQLNLFRVELLRSDPDTDAGLGFNPSEDESDPPEFDQSLGKIKRNALCPCGSGKKFKHCHGKIV